ncbi:DUF456 domain-containing protein [Cellulomonas endometrii]|uniref:DUF456 domain-containing protein n=1 Tax=Cellulomonas endometrii TaxID=3036301 RepID=UPI0024ACA533|nr:DUF456 domain-containing protein [Cellulomonas endometrii]
MSGPGEVLVGLAILVGLLGVVVQVLPGALVVLGAVAVWAVVTGGTAAWVVLGVAVAATVVSGVAKYLVAGRYLTRTGLRNRTLAWGGLLGVVGFFVIPVVGLPVGFVGGVYLAERLQERHGHPEAWRATVAAIKATGITILIELAGALVATLAWVVGLVVT